jgi:hypothetical protein
MSCTIFEADKDRNQGGIIDLRPRAGQLALKGARLLSELQRNSLPEAEASNIIKADGLIA